MYILQIVHILNSFIFWTPDKDRTTGNRQPDPSARQSPPHDD